MKTKEQIIEKLKSLIEETSFGATKAETIRPSDRLIDDLGVDSLDYATVMLSCEEWVDVKIKEDKVRWDEVRTVEDLALLFVKHQQ